MASLSRQIDALVKATKATAKVKLPRTEEELAALIGFTPRPDNSPSGSVQAESLAARQRFNVEVWHRRAGKSYSKVFKLIRSAIACPHDDGRYVYLGPTQDQVKDIAFHYLKTFGERIPGATIKETAKELWLPTLRGSISRIKLYGVDNPRQSIRGLYIDGGVADEWQDIQPTVFTEQVRPTLMDSGRGGLDEWGYPNQWFDFIGTPKGRNQLYDFWNRARLWFDGKPVMLNVDGELKPVFSDEWRAAIYKASETGILNAAQLETARAEMGQKYAQEMECSFDAAITGSVYGAHLADLRKLGRICTLPINRHLPVHTAWDLGANDQTIILLWQEIGEEIGIVDCLTFGHTRFVEMVAEMEARCGKGTRFRYGYHILPHDVNVTELGGGVRKKQLQDLGVRPIVVAPKLRIEDGIAAAQALLPKCYIDDSRCMEFLDALSFYHRARDEKLGVLRDTPVHDWSADYADAFRMLAVGKKKRYSADRPSSSTHHTAEF